MFNVFHFIYYDALYQPIYNLLIFFYQLSPGQDMGLAIIFLTVFLRVLLLPLSIRGARAERRMELLEPEMEKMKHRYRYDIGKQKAATRQLLRENNVGIFSNIFALLFQILFFIVLYSIFSSGLQPGGENYIYPFNVHLKVIDPSFLGIFNLVVPNARASLFAAGVVFLQNAIRRVGHRDEATTLEKAMLFGLPIGIYIGTIVLPASKAVFIATSVIFSLWLKFMKYLVVRFFLRDQKLKENINQLWTS